VPTGAALLLRNRYAVAAICLIQEGLHGLGAHCLTYNGSTSCSTIFPAPPTLGATFNRTLLHRAGEVISTEARVYNNYNGTRSCK
jgi:hypothetical protein